MGVTGPKIILSADPTVILPAADAGTVDGLMAECALKPDGQYICFTLRPWPGFEEKTGALAAGDPE